MSAGGSWVSKGVFMQKVFTMAGVFVLLLALFLVSPAKAEVSVDSSEVTVIGEVTKAGILPDSPFYFIKNSVRWIQLTITTDSLKKAKLELKFAGEDVLATQEMVKKGKEISEEQIEKYQEHFDKVLEHANKAEKEGKDTSELAQKILENHLKHVEVLLKNLEKIDNVKAKEAITQAIANSTKNIDERARAILESGDYPEYKNDLSEKIEEALEKIDENASETEEKIQEALEETEKKSREALKEAQKEIEEADKKVEEESKEAEDKLEEAENEVEDPSKAVEEAKKAEEDAKEELEKAQKNTKEENN